MKKKEIDSATEDQIDNVLILHKSISPLILSIILLWVISGFAHFILGLILALLRSNQVPAFNYALLTTLLFLLLQALFSIASIFITIRWISEYYVIRPTNITTRRGVFSSEEETHPTRNIIGVQVYQNYFGRLFNYGNLKISSLSQKLDLNSIPDPHLYADMIKQTNPSIKGETKGPE